MISYQVISLKLIGQNLSRGVRILNLQVTADYG